MAATNAAPLIALDAVIIDTETTGLDPKRARVIEVGAVRLAAGRVDGETFRSLVAPGEPIPKTATAIHGIGAAELAGAPSFGEVWPRLREFSGDRVTIGHSLGFDVAVLRRECARIGADFSPRRTLDTRLLAQVVAPDLADFSIEGLCAWLGLPLEGRHSALGDATATARIFCALVPKLREGNIRTFGEAAAACRALTDALDAQHRAGWATPGAEPARADAERTLSRVDSYPYRHRVRDVMSATPLFIAAERTLADALRRMMQARVSSLYVHETGADSANVRAADAGIVTERDILRVLDQKGAAALGTPVREVMCTPLATVPADAFVYRAIGRMARLKYRHLGVVDDAGRIVGALSARNLLRLRAGEAISLGDEIDQAGDVHALAAAWAKLPQVAAALLAEGLSGRDIAAVISRELGALTRQAAILAERRMEKDGRGRAPCAYSVAVLGSAGRSESLLAMDQDNALIFADGVPDGPEDRWFAQLGVHVADFLHEAGVPYCKGGVMAKNPQWRGSVATWRARIEQWIGRSQPQDLLSIDIFFDLRGVHGAGHLSDTLWRAAFDMARGDVAFVKALAGAAGEFESGIGWFGRLHSENGRIDLKKHGLFPIVTTARLLAIRHHVVERSTPARLAGVRALNVGGDSDLDALEAAHGVFADLILAQQIEDVEQGRPPGNAVALKRLSARDNARLRTALEAVRPLNELARDLLFGGS
jgi:DNA polymerase-3 subunit epsilon/CBS domain-containing protein